MQSQSHSVFVRRAFSEMTYYSALPLEKLGRRAVARKLLRELLDYAKKLYRAEAKIDYFATSLPTMLLFEDDLPKRQQTTALFLMAQASLGLGRKRQASTLIKKVLRFDRSHAQPTDLMETLVDDCNSKKGDRKEKAS